MHRRLVKFFSLPILLLLVLLVHQSSLSAQSISGVINSYAAVTAVTGNSATLNAIGPFQVGDKVLIIQMKGATITTTNTPAFGAITALGNAGNFEFATISSTNGNTVTFSSNLCKTYTPSGKVQLVRVAVYSNVTIAGAVTAQPWNGSTGGIVAIEATNSITFNANINVSGQGFIGGAVYSGWFACGDSNYANQNAGKKGEGIATPPITMDSNRAPLANGGGGSNTGNPGAGGGANGGNGGRGGNEFFGSCQLNASYGLGGIAPSYVSFRAYLGGGGGGGYKDNGLNATAGSNGGGMVFLTSPTINGNNFMVDARGANVIGNTDSEGAGAGGAGGYVHYMCSNTTSAINLDLRGGNGGNIFNTLWSSACHGPGGGGGGGAVSYQQGSLPTNVTNLLAGGNPGMVLHNGPACAGTSHSAAAGAPGIQVFNFPAASAPNIPDLGQDFDICQGQTVTLQTSMSFPTYTWNNGSVTSSIAINSPGIYWVEVSSGCSIARDSIVVGLSSFSFNIGPDVTICQGETASIQAIGVYNSITWSTGETSNSIQENTPGVYSATATNVTGCTAQDNMQVVQNPTVYNGVIDSICVGSTYFFNGQNLNQAGVYTTTLQNIFGCDSIVTLQLSFAQPSSSSISASICDGDTYFFNGQTISVSGQYFATIPSVFGCDSLIQLTLIVNPLPIVSVQDTTVCVNTPLTLFASGALTYDWDVPQNANGSISISPLQTSVYNVFGIDAFGCISTIESLTVTVDPTPIPNFYIEPDQVEVDDPTITLYNVTAGNSQSTWTILGSSFVNDQSSFNYSLPFQEGNYTVQLMSETALGCADSLQLTAIVRDNVALYVPNSFTPDGEEFNTVFLPVFSTGFTPKNYVLSIYDRWGGTIFESNNYLVGWDGRIEFVMCPDGVYNYQIRYTKKDVESPVVIDGHVNLLR
jgi:gliding motility-associated-like protein